MAIRPTQEGCARGQNTAARTRTARITPGLEPAIVDHGLQKLTALDPTDHRVFDVNVAGPAALIIAKAIKIEERLADAAAGSSARLKEKDALDIFRLLQEVETEDLAKGIELHLADEHAREVSLRGLRVLKEHGSAPGAQLPNLATNAAAGDPTVSVAFVVLTQQFLEATTLR